MLKAKSFQLLSNIDGRIKLKNDKLCDIIKHTTQIIHVSILQISLTKQIIIEEKTV